MFHVFHFLKSDMVFGIMNLFCEYSMASQWKKLPAFNTFHVNIQGWVVRKPINANRVLKVKS